MSLASYYKPKNISGKVGVCVYTHKLKREIKTFIYVHKHTHISI